MNLGARVESQVRLNGDSLFQQGVFIEKMTPPQRLTQLISKLMPVRTQVDLIRVGGELDGGYLIPDDVEGVTACFSPGVDLNASFEQDLLNKKGINSYLADYSVDGPPMGFEPIAFLKKFLGIINDDVYITLDSWVMSAPEFSSGGDLLLQMDIEGGEYLAILGASEEVLKRFRIIVIEIHNVAAWGQPNYFEIVETFFCKLLNHFYVLHNHPNNCCGLVNLGGVSAPRVFELTLLRKDRAKVLGMCNQFPHPLDRPNVLDRGDLYLPQNWFFSKKIIPLGHVDAFLNDVCGVIHIGANVGQERSHYADLDIRVVWVEPIPNVFQVLKRNLGNFHKQRAYNYLLTNQDGVCHELKIANNGGESSSIFELAGHKNLWPSIHYVETMNIFGTTLQSMIERENINISDFQALVVDTQGSELMVLQGAGDLIKRFRYIKLEAADFESYEGCCQIGDLGNYLKNFGFDEVQRVKFAGTGFQNYFNLIYANVNAANAS